VTVVVGLVVGGLALLGAFRGPGDEVPEDHVPDAAETALLTVEEFASTWNTGDGPAVERLIAGNWTSVVLPGFADPRFEAEDGRGALAEGIRFLSSVARLSLGPCHAEVAPPDSGSTAVVDCSEARFEGDYLDAVARNIWTDRNGPGPDLGQGMRFEVTGDRLVSWEGGNGPYSPQAYCIWAEQARTEAATSRFDLHCRPSTRPADARVHVELAAQFLAAGAPLPTGAEAEARLSALYVDRFVEHHNLGDAATIRGWLSHEVGPGDLPGFAGAAVEPAMADYLLWSTRMLDLHAGTCEVEWNDSRTIVTCPDMMITGPLLAGPLARPTRFVLASSNRPGAVARAYGRVLAVEPLFDDVLSVDATCRRVRLAHPDVASSAFDDACHPVYTKDAADLLAAALSDT
jgi:hypothetical protein